MAASDKMLENNEKDLNDGHVVHYSYYVRNLNTIQRLPYKRRFTTKCQVLSTSWRFKMLFQQVPGADTVSCSITLRRTDGVKIPVMASMSVSLSRATHGSPFFSEEFEKNGILPGEEIQESIAEVIPTEHMRTTFYKKIDIAVIIIIRNCHSMIKTDLERNLRAQKKRMMISNI
ncbi:hypothetical protein AVEN_66601-1 [Araneus ventricosus]|uniref:MATH domain-containing protein n=1 Tax=Araneus ventricosus TaxID=182803 RepID=A0A4Y2M0K4_ARAVE|nr:hypothetical protein AVEN_66601-1 [Araneus ventricosus]